MSSGRENGVFLDPGDEKTLLSAVLTSPSTNGAGVRPTHDGEMRESPGMHGYRSPAGKAVPAGSFPGGEINPSTSGGARVTGQGFFLPLFGALVSSDRHVEKRQRGIARLRSRRPAGAGSDVPHAGSPRHRGSDITRQANFNKCLFSQNRFFKQSVNIHVKMLISVEIFLIFLELVIKIMFFKLLFLKTFFFFF